MLTNMFYYGFYRPYIVSPAPSDGNRQTRMGRIEGKSYVSRNSDAAFLLNKSLKTDVVKYARNVSEFVVGTKDAAKNLITDMENFNKNVFNEGLETAKTWIADDLQKFVDTYNGSADFLLSQSHSGTLRDYGDHLIDNLENNGENLPSLGVSMSDDGKLAFNGDWFARLDQSELNIAIGENLNLFQVIYDDSTDILTQPLTEHMKFRNLNYYYNYKYGSIQADTFKIIESGMLIDKVV